MADEYLDSAGANFLAGKIKENTQYGETLTAILAKDHATSLRVYATLSDRPSAIDVANGVLLAVGERCFVVATGKYYKVTAVDNETNAITWEETDALFGDGSGGSSDVVKQDLSYSTSSVLGIKSLVQNAFQKGSFEKGKSYVGKFYIKEAEATASFYGGQGAMSGTYDVTIDADGSGKGVVNFTGLSVQGSFMYDVACSTDGIWTANKVYATPIEVKISQVVDYFRYKVNSSFDRDLLLTIDTDSYTDFLTYFGKNNTVFLKFSSASSGGAANYTVTFTTGNFTIYLGYYSLSIYEREPLKRIGGAYDFIDKFIGDKEDTASDFSSCRIAYIVPGGVTMSDNYLVSNILSANPHAIIMSSYGNLPNTFDITGYNGEYPAILVCDMVTKQCKLGYSKGDYLDAEDMEIASAANGLGNVLLKGLVIFN